MEEQRLTMQDEVRTTDAPARACVRGEYAAYVRRKRLVLAALAAVLVATSCASLGIGSLSLSASDVLLGALGLADAQVNAVVQNIRLPRVLTAVVARVALALAGCAYQATLRNPLASASTLGISQGAAFGASIAIIVIGGGAASAGAAASAYEGASMADPLTTALAAFAGAMLSTGVIFALSRFREMTPEAIVLLGVALSALFTGGTALVQYFAEDSQVAAVVFWTFGDLGRVTRAQLLAMALACALSAAFFFAHRWSYNAIEGGEGLAHGLGVDVRRTRLLSMVVASACASTVIAFCGIVNFVGLVAPHVMRRLLGADYRYLLPASAMAGATLLLFSDAVCHLIVAPLILPIGAITSILGAPVFIWLLFRGVSR